MYLVIFFPTNNVYVVTEADARVIVPLFLEIWHRDVAPLACKGVKCEALALCVFETFSATTSENSNGRIHARQSIIVQWLIVTELV